MDVALLKRAEGRLQWALHVTQRKYCRVEVAKGPQLPGWQGLFRVWGSICLSPGMLICTSALILTTALYGRAFFSITTRVRLGLNNWVRQQTEQLRRVLNYPSPLLRVSPLEMGHGADTHGFRYTCVLRRVRIVAAEEL